LNDVSNFAAGFGDALTFDTTKRIRELLNGGQDIVDECSSAYGAGSISGTGVGLGLGGAAAARVAGWSVQFKRFNFGGGGMNVLKDGALRFGAHWNKFKYKGEVKGRFHYHRGPTKTQRKKHRPWQGGF